MKRTKAQQEAAKALQGVQATLQPHNEPKPRVQLTGQDGNAFAILARCHRAADAAGWSEARWAFVREVMLSHDYQQLLSTVLEHFDVY